MQVLWRPTPDRLGALLTRSVDEQLTYGPVGASAREQPPVGYTRLQDRAVVGRGRAAWGRLAAALTSWAVHREAGMLLRATHPTAMPGCTVVNAAPLGPLALLAPCRVVAQVDQPHRSGFAYGTLPGHPLDGEEQFTAELLADGRVQLRIQSFSRPAGRLAAAPAVVRAGQHLVNRRRYLAAARRIAR